MISSMMHYTYLFFLWIIIYITPVTAAPLFMRDQLQKAEKGDYLVTTVNKTATLLHIYSRTPQVLTLEEVSIPASRAPTYGWREWISQGAPGNTSWIMYEVDLSSGELLALYSFTQQNWCLSQSNILGTLLNLPMYVIPESERKRTGFCERTGGVPGFKPLWQPPIITNGERLEGITSTAFRTQWPKDGSELAGRTMELYFPNANANSGFPTYFPFWLEAKGTITKAHLRVIDSGKNLTSPQSPLPPH